MRLIHLRSQSVAICHENLQDTVMLVSNVGMRNGKIMLLMLFQCVYFMPTVRKSEPHPGQKSLDTPLIINSFERVLLVHIAKG